MKLFLMLIVALLPLEQFSQSNTEIFLFDLKTENEVFELSNFKNISNNEGYDNQPSFMNNETILYAGTRNGQTDIVLYDLMRGSKTWLCTTDGGEYSPLKIPNQPAVSAIRLDTDGKQLLYRYDLKNGTSTAIMETLIVGYHTWFDSNTLLSSVLVGDALSLYKTDVKEKQNKLLVKNVGRSLHKIPNTKLVSYISKANDTLWEIKSIDPLSAKSELIVHTLLNTEDMCWTPSGSILMANDGLLYTFNPNMDAGWVKVASLSDYGIDNITRLAVSPNGKKLAIVAEFKNEKLEPKIENIKWISGNWKGEALGGQTEENWSEPSAGSMMGIFKLIDEGKVAFYEIEIIREVENSLILQLKHFDNELKGWETKDETVDFKLKEITWNKVVFEGMTFEKINENSMIIYVDTKNENGDVEILTFNFKK